MTTPSTPERVTPLVHLKRAFGWNVGRVVPSAAERARLVAAGVTDPAAQRYAAWRGSLLRVAFVPTLLAAVLAVLDTLDEGAAELTALGLALGCAWLLAALALPVACAVGVRSWVRPGAGARALRSCWLVAFLLPLVYSLLPVDALIHVRSVGPHPAAVAAVEHVAEHAGADLEDVDVPAKLEAVQTMTLDFVLSGAAFLMLLPGVLSLIPGAVNGCLRIKSAFPAAQVPGWLLVTAAPAFLLFWLVMLVLVSPAVQGPLLLLGIVLWAGSPLVYALFGRVFVRSQLGADEAAQIGRVKRTAGLVALAGIACLLLFVATAKVAGLRILGTDEERTMAARLEALSEQDHEVSLDDVRTAYADSDALLYVLDLGSVRFVIDLFAKLLLVTAVFADLVLRATLTAWRNDRALRARSESGGYDASASATSAALGVPADAPA